MVCILQGYYDARPKLHFSLSPPLPKANFDPVTKSNKPNYSANSMHAAKSKTNNNNNISNYSNNNHKTTEQCTSVTSDDKAAMLTEEDAASDYIQWLHAMKLVAQLPGGMPPEFRRKLWLSLADKYLKAKKIDWAKEEEKCFCENFREDDEELGIQIVKDLHRTGSNLCTGPSATINQAKLKRILLGYARYNPEIGYCQGFNMLGALILQVMDKNEYESMKVMIYLVEGVLPPGYFHGSMCGLQADMGVFRELMQTKLPRLAKHLQKLQGPIENAFEPPLTNVFTMQWFLTMFCTCLPMTCVLRVWDLVLIEGSDVLLRTALVLWSLLEERVLSARTADDFYCKMGSFSSELLNGHLIDSNGLVEKVVKFGPITDIQKLRDKHLYNIAPLQHKSGIQLYYDDEDPESDDASRLAVATIWGLPWGRRGSQGKETVKQQPAENKERLALDISLLKKQYDRLRERQKQAQLILTTACNTALPSNPPSVPVNQLLLGRQAILSNRGRRTGAPANLIPPARKPSLPAVLQIKPTNKKLTRGETLHWRDTDFGKSRRDSLSWREIKADRDTILHEGNVSSLKSQKLRRGIGKSDSSSYSEESDPENGSSTDTSLCDEEDLKSTDERTHSSIEDSPIRRARSLRKKKVIESKSTEEQQENLEKPRPKSWAPSSSEIPFVLMPSDSPNQSGDEQTCKEVSNEISTDNTRKLGDGEDDITYNYSPLASDLLHAQMEQTIPDTQLEFNEAQHSWNFDAKNAIDGHKKQKVSAVGVTNQYFERVTSAERPKKLNLSYSLNEEDSIRNAFVDKPVHISPTFASSDTLERSYSLKSPAKEAQTLTCKDDYSKDLLFVNHKEASFHTENQPDLLKDTLKMKFEKPLDNFTKRIQFSAAEETEISNKLPYSEKLRNKRRDPRRMTLTRSSTIEIEERFRALEQTDVFKTIPDNNIQKKIPSTADLEARYSSLQKQLRSDSQQKSNSLSRRHTSFETYQIPQKQKLADADLCSTSLSRQISSNETHRGNQKPKSASSKKESPTEDKRGGSAKEVVNPKSGDVKSAIQKSTDGVPHEEIKTEKPVLKKIPSTAELEDRYNALERRLSEQKSVALKTKKKPPEEISAETLERKSPLGESKESINEEQNDKEKCSDSSNTKTEKENNEESELGVVHQENTEKEPTHVRNASNIDNDEKERLENQSEPRLSKEVDSSQVVKDPESPQSKSKEEKDIKTRTIINRKESCTMLDDKPTSTSSLEEPKSTRNTSQNRSSNEMPVKEEKKTLNGNLKKQHTEIPGGEDSETGSENKKKEQDQSFSSPYTENKNEREKIHRKSPPTTEELEKRFKAMEKQLSLNTIDQATEANQKNANEGKEAQPEKNKFYEDNSKSKSEMKTAHDGKKEINTESEKKEKLESEVSQEQFAKKSVHEHSTKGDSKEELDGKETNEKLSTKTANQQDNYIAPRRRGSEPPSTVDLEKRYESLKRRMSSGTVTEGTLKMADVSEALSHKSRKECKGTVKEEYEEDIKSENPISEQKSKNLPTTEDLEGRYEALQMNSKTEDKKKTKGKREENTTEDCSSTQTKKRTSPRKSIDAFKIPQAPPQPVSTDEDFLNVLVLDATRRSQQRALVEELQNKIKTPLNGENLKPSTINPNRKKYPKAHNRIDGTSEAHASSAYHWSENHELWHPKKTVRRFSDLPSRADLENRLEFLERQLYAKFEKQRCAGDSEVTSMKTANIASTKSVDNELPSTSQPHPTTSPNLEERVQALEKQLSENSLKLLETLRLREKEVCTNDVALSRQVSTETINVTGRELVRYTHSGELEETENHKPLNINIHIKMSLSSLGEPSPSTLRKLPTTEELEKRLQILEKQIEESNIRRTMHAPTEVKSEEKSKHTTNKDSPIETVLELDKLSEKMETQGVDVQEDEVEILKENPVEILEEKHEHGHSSQSSDDQQPKINENENKNLDREKTKCQEMQTKSKTESDEDEKAKVSNNQNEVSERKEKEVCEEEKSITNQVSRDKVEKTEKIEVSSKESQQHKQAEVEKISKTNTENILKDKNDETIDAGTKVKSVDSNKTTVVLLMDNQPKTMNVRRLTRANTAELEGLFEALEKQLSNRNLVKGTDGKLVHVDHSNKEKANEDGKALKDLTNEIVQFTSNENKDKSMEEKANVVETKTEEKQKKEEEPFDWGENPIKHHLKRKTVYLPSTKELEARFRSFERQIKFLEDVEKIDVEQRLNEIERKIKLQYSLSHEKDLNKFLELCEGKDVDELETSKPETERRSRSPKRSDSRKHTPHTSPANKKGKSPYASPSRSRSRGSPSPARSAKQSPYTSPSRKQYEDNNVPCTEDLEYRFRALDLKRSKSKENVQKMKKQPIHPLEMLLDPSPDEIPTTGELEHRMRLMEEKQQFQSQRSKRRYPCDSPKRELPTEEELEARVRALEEERSFDIKTQKKFQEFNQKLKQSISPPLTFDEFKAARSRDQSPHNRTYYSKSKSIVRTDSEEDAEIDTFIRRPTSPKVIRFSDQTEEYEDESPLEPLSMHQRTQVLTGSNSSIYSNLAAAEDLEARGAQLLRETSPMRRTGTHTGVPLKTDLNINDRLDSIKNTIKSIDHLCEDKPYRKEKCQRYIDSLFSDSLHFSKMDDQRRRDYGPPIRVSEHTERPSESLYGRCLGSAESIRSTSPLRAASPLHHRSNRELRRDISPRRYRAEDREEHESRVRRDNMFSNLYFSDNHSNVSRESRLTHFHKVNRHLDPNKYDVLHYLSNSQSASRSPSNSPYGSMEMTHRTTNTTTQPTLTPTKHSRMDFDRPLSAYRPSCNNIFEHDPYRRTTNTPVYNPGNLEIPHTTVTSTCYDRNLTEKEVENSLNRTPNRSPVISPSITSKSYTEASNKISPTAVTAPLTTSNNPVPSTSGNLLTVSSLPPAPTLVSPHSYTAITQISSANTTTTTSITSNYTLPTLDTSYLPQDMRIRSCDNIPMHTTPNTTTSTVSNTQSVTLNNSVTAFSSSIGNTGFAYNPITLSSLSTSTKNQPINGFSATTSLSTGVYNPVMPFIMRQPPDPATISSLNALGQNNSNIDCNLPKL